MKSVSRCSVTVCIFFSRVCFSKGLFDVSKRFFNPTCVSLCFVKVGLLAMKNKGGRTRRCTRRGLFKLYLESICVFWHNTEVCPILLIILHWRISCPSDLQTSLLYVFCNPLAQSVEHLSVSP